MIIIADLQKLKKTIIIIKMKRIIFKNWLWKRTRKLEMASSWVMLTIKIIHWNKIWAGHQCSYHIDTLQKKINSLKLSYLSIIVMEVLQTYWPGQFLKLFQLIIFYPTLAIYFHKMKKTEMSVNLIKELFWLHFQYCISNGSRLLCISKNTTPNNPQLQTHPKNNLK